MNRIIFILAILIVFMLPNTTKADGGVFPPPDKWIYETEQNAAIIYEDNTETLVLQTSFQGDAKDFAYIIPTPKKPEVTKISEDIFDNLLDLTIFQNTNIAVPLAQEGGFGTDTASKEVNVVEEKEVGLYDVKILSATDADALYDWLKDNNFSYPENKKYILDDYIQNEWFFTTAKISTESITSDIETKLHRGKLTPLKLVFQTENIVFPLKISGVIDEKKIPSDIYSISANPETPSKSYTTPASAPPLSDSTSSTSQAVYPRSEGIGITIYIFADHKKEISGFSEIYANWIKPKEIEKLAKDDNGNPWVKPKSKMYLTKLSGYMNISDMTNDLFPDNAENNDKIGVPSWWERNTNIIIVLEAIFFILFYLLTYWQYSPRNKITHIICWILQIMGFVFVGLPLLFIFFYLLSNTYFPYYYGYNSLPAVIILSIPATMIMLIIGEYKYQKQLR